MIEIKSVVYIRWESRLATGEGMLGHHVDALYKI